MESIDACKSAVIAPAPPVASFGSTDIDQLNPAACLFFVMQSRPCSCSCCTSIHLRMSPLVLSVALPCALVVLLCCILPCSWYWCALKSLLATATRALIKFSGLKKRGEEPAHMQEFSRCVLRSCTDLLFCSLRWSFSDRR